jgi:hypothetical protein
MEVKQARLIADRSVEIAKTDQNFRVFRRAVEFAAGCRAPGVTLKPGVEQPAASDGGWQTSVEALKACVAAA